MMQEKKRNSGQALGRPILLPVSLLMIFLSFLTVGCMPGDPEGFIRHQAKSIYFRYQDSFTKARMLAPAGTQTQVDVRGLFFATGTSHGRRYSVSLRAKCTFPPNKAPKFYPNKVRVWYKEQELLFYGSGVFKEDIAKGYLVYDIDLETDHEKTLSIIERAPEFYGPDLKIDLTGFMEVDGRVVPIEAIVAYPRNPLERSDN